MDSTVGVLLDELPESSRDDVVSALLAKNDAFWAGRATAQVRLMVYRGIFRPIFYGAEFLQLPLPPESLWRYQWKGNARRTSVQGHDMVVRDYKYISTLVTDAVSPGVSSKQLENVGGVTIEKFVFPVDPELLFQRTGYACMDEVDFPKNSVDSEEVDSFYDNLCGVEDELTAHFGCHQTELPLQSCNAALRSKVGSIQASLKYTRLEYDANKIAAEGLRVIRESSNDPNLQLQETADLVTYNKDFRQNRVTYQYFAPDACEVVESCIGAPGWRRLLNFHSSDENVGKTPLHIGPVDYFFQGVGFNSAYPPGTTWNEIYNIYELSTCHQHYHFTEYGNFSIDAFGANQTNKQGFCLQSTNRSANHEFSPLNNPYWLCDVQGVAPGWVDQYKIGLPCQWVDITDVDTTSAPVETNLTFKSNPNEILCEGTFAELKADGTPEFEDTGIPANQTGSLDTIWRPKCNVTPGALENNVKTYETTIPKAGDTYVSAPCTRGQLGPLRNCGYTFSESKTCTPSAPVTLTCSNAGGSQPQVARICESSHLLGRMACIEEDAITSKVVDGATQIQFTCPAKRDDYELGGLYAVFTGAAFPDHASSVVTCQE